MFLIESNNIFHRDIKPENILLMNVESLAIKISDFGVSRQLIEDRSTIQGTLVGTPVFLSPALWSEFEKGNFQLENIGKVQHNIEKSDVYSLGITFLQCALLLKNEVC
jgi:serine/threonine protein kinase